MTVQNAKDVAIEISKLNWELIDLTYRFEWDDPVWIGKNIDREEATKRRAIVEEWSKKKKQYIASIRRRVKYEALLGRVVARDHLGRVPFKVVYDMEPVEGLDVNYRVLSTLPEGEVRITEETLLDLVESEKSW